MSTNSTSADTTAANRSSSPQGLDSTAGHDQRASGRGRWPRRLAWLFGAWLLFACLPSFDVVRALMIWPLYTTQDIDRADAAYVMADGYANFERLRAASDLYHQSKVPLIYLTEETDSSWGYDYPRQRSLSFTEHSEQYLKLLGVPRQAIRRIPKLESSLGSLSEAQSFADQRSPACQAVVVVTSAPHTLRSWLCFRRSMPDAVEVSVFSATEPLQSAELTEPIWHEYLKLVVYWGYLSVFAGTP